MTVLVETAPHEFAVNYLFNARGLHPYFAADNRVKTGGGSQTATFKLSGEEWRVKLYYQESGIDHPGSVTPEGTRFAIETVREFRFAVRAVVDSVGQRKFNAHLSPRWPDMRSENGTKIPVPEGFGEGVNVWITGSNIEFDQYLELLQRAAGAVGINPAYFQEPHPYSNVQDAERYVRLFEDVSGPVHARDGPIVRMGHLLENDRDGYRKVVQNDQDERGDQLPGYYHTVTLGEKRISEAFPSHELPKELKHYYAKEALSFSQDHPLRHPKVGASYQVSRWDGKLGVSPREIGQLNRELEETVLSALANAGIPVRPTGSTFCKDGYFSVEESERDRDIVELELARIEQSQESVVIKHVADGLSPVEWESLQVLVSDGGEVAPKDIAETTGRHPDSVRRALNRIDDLVAHEYGSVSLRSNYVAELVHEAVTEAKQSTRRAVEAGAKAIEAAKRGLDERTSAFIAWAATHGVDVNERENKVTIDFGELDPKDHRKEVRRLLREGSKLWEAANRNISVYRGGRYRYQIREKEHDLSSIEADTKIRTIGGRVWRVLR